MPQLPEEQTGAEFGGDGQALPHEPQLLRLLLTLVSQPFAASPSQFPLSAIHERQLFTLQKAPVPQLVFVWE
jgi:hypothetical protein